MCAGPWHLQSSDMSIKERAAQCGSPMSPSAIWQALTVRHAETVRQRDDCPLGQASPRWDGWPYRPLCARWFSALHLGHGRRKGGHRVVPSHGVLWLGTLGHALIEPKTPFYSRFDLLALVLPNRTNNAISGRPKAKAARLRAANPEQVSNLANGVAVPEQLGCPMQDGRFQVPRHPPDSCPPRIRSRMPRPWPRKVRPHRRPVFGPSRCGPRTAPPVRASNRQVAAALSPGRAHPRGGWSLAGDRSLPHDERGGRQRPSAGALGASSAWAATHQTHLRFRWP